MRNTCWEWASCIYFLVKPRLFSYIRFLIHRRYCFCFSHMPSFWCMQCFRKGYPLLRISHDCEMGAGRRTRRLPAPTSNGLAILCTGTMLVIDAPVPRPLKKTQRRCYKIKKKTQKTWAVSCASELPPWRAQRKSEKNIFLLQLGLYTAFSYILIFFSKSLTRGHFRRRNFLTS